MDVLAQRLERQRLRVLLVALAMLLGQIAGPAHELLVPHRVCEAHGELLEGRALPELRAEPVDGPTLSQEGSDAGHEHCPLGLLVKEGAEVRIHAPRVAPLDLAVLGHAAAAPRTDPIAPLVLAPKQSPPV